MAQGMRQGIFLAPPNMKGNDEENEGAAWMEGKLNFPITSLSPNPKIPFT